MAIVKINKNGFLACEDISDATIDLEISEEAIKKISCCKIGYCWQYVDGIWKEVIMQSDKTFRVLREIECFNIIDNRSKLWYDSLTKEQYAELQTWYKAWLNITETKIIPEKPAWLK